MVDGEARPLFPPQGIRDAADLAAPLDPKLAALFAYWQSKRAGLALPSRADIDPVELRGLINHVMLYDVVEPGRLYRIRLVGQAIIDFVGVNNTGRFATETMPPDAAARMLEILNSVTATGKPRFRAGNAYWHQDRSFRRFEACFLPLSPDGATVDKILAGNVFAVAGGSPDQPPVAKPG